jgi:hypothetical protein
LLYRRYIVTFVKFLKYIIVDFTPQSFSFIPFSPIAGIVSICFNFLFYTWIHNISTSFSLLNPFLISHMHTHWYQSPDRNCFTFLLSIFEKRHVCLFRIALQGVFLWHFYVYMYDNLNWFMPSIFLLSILVPFLWWFQQI